MKMFRQIMVVTVHKADHQKVVSKASPIQQDF